MLEDEFPNRILRQRRRKEAGVLYTENRLSDTVKRLDFYPKIKTGVLKRQTRAGLVLSVLGFIFMVFLPLQELIHYWSGTYDSRLTVDSGVTQDVPIYLNITFHNLRCTSVHLDAVDAAGEMRIDLHHGLYKSPVTASGQLVFTASHPHLPSPDMHEPDAEEDESQGVFSFFASDYDPAKDPKSKEFCGPCEIYPAANMEADRRRKRGEKVKCCNTCQSVMDHFKEKGAELPTKDMVEQCIQEASDNNPGCNIAGSLTVEKVKGNFHFAPGGTKRVGFRLLHSFSEQQEREFDVSHTVHEMRFGEDKDDYLSFMKQGMRALDSKTLTLPPGKLAKVRYHINAVPVVYTEDCVAADEEAESDSMIEGADERGTAFELSAKRHVDVFEAGDPAYSPGLIFDYDFFHMQITHVFKRPPISGLLLRICKMVGGFYVVAALLDRMAWAIETKMM